jgi:adenosylhomocysteine nucleosidase
MIGIIGAMEEEVKNIIEEMVNPKQKTIAGMVFWQGDFHGRPTVSVICGIGKVNAAVCAQLLITVYKVERIIFTGVAGALDPDVKVGDVVISRDCIQHDIDVTGSGYDFGVIPRMETNIFMADSEMVKLAVAAGKKLEEEGLSLRVHVGRVLSGDQYVCNREKSRWLHTYFSGTCVEMEGAAVAQVCYLNKVPFVIIRSISDGADDDAETTYERFKDIALRNSHRMTSYMVQEL